MLEETMSRSAMNVRRLLVVLLVVALGGGAVYLYDQHQASAAVEATDTPAAIAPEKRRIPVVVTEATTRAFERRLVVQGTVEAHHTAIISPRIGGVLERIYVDAGDEVKANETILFEIDALKLEKTLEIRKGELAVAHFARLEKDASLERVMVQLEKAHRDEARHRKLFEADQVVSEATYEQYQTGLKEVEVLVRHAQSLVDLASEQERQAARAVELAEKDLRDTVVYAPIKGVVSERYKEPGEMGSVGKQVMRIEDPSLVEISAWLPASAYTEVVPGEARMHVSVGAIDLGEQIIVYRSPTIDAQFRTFEVHCLVQSPPEGVAPGAMATVRVVLERRDALGVPTEAIVTRRSGPVVFTAINAIASMHAVTTGLETDGWTEVSADGLEADMPVVTMGQFLLDQAALVSVQEGRD